VCVARVKRFERKPLFNQSQDRSCVVGRVINKSLLSKGEMITVRKRITGPLREQPRPYDGAAIAPLQAGYTWTDRPEALFWSRQYVTAPAAGPPASCRPL
jgi:hypothetical protein